MNNQLIVKAIKAFNAEGLKETDAERTLSNFVMDMTGVDSVCPFRTHSYSGGLIKHSINELNPQAKKRRKDYWLNRINQ